MLWLGAAQWSCSEVLLSESTLRACLSRFVYETGQELLLSLQKAGTRKSDLHRLEEKERKLLASRKLSGIRQEARSFLLRTREGFCPFTEGDTFCQPAGAGRHCSKRSFLYVEKRERDLLRGLWVGHIRHLGRGF